ncbi:hypothetical protein F503_01024 [Ophiostoma piceae UAMH 11346]|uniref:Uncharacterized protein n=1 Tax=Ophiostoma piceae (strain UAMH 11346) TaxID=1262450 RepID=S3C8I7_OPHP1|nr:hypothetical protein F503_01024 [Ophiostoma piceae UAMH 11346]
MPNDVNTVWRLWKPTTAPSPVPTSQQNTPIPPQADASTCTQQLSGLYSPALHTAIPATPPHPSSSAAAMARKADVPNAWDDDWEAEADKLAAKDKQASSRQRIDDQFNDDEKDTPFSGGALLAQPPPDEAKPVLLSRAERLAQHAEKNRKLWETADNPEEFHFLSAGSPSTSNNTGSSAPTILSPATAFRPAMTVLSRKPAPQMIRRRDPVTGLEQLTIRDDAAEAEAEARAAATRKQETPEQIRQRQMKEREERQRKYDEARAKIFGEPLPPSSSNNGSNNNKSSNADNGSNTHTSTPGSMATSRQTSPTPKAGHNSNQNTPSSPQSHGGRGRGRGRGQGGSYRGDRGGAGNGHGNGNGNDGSFNRRGHHHHHSSSNGQSSSAAGQSSPSSSAHTSSQKLFDPNYSPKPGSRRQGGNQILNGLSRNNSNGYSSEPSPFPSRTGTPREDDLVTRAPKGPDGTGRGGFGFSRRGG